MENLVKALEHVAGVLESKGMIKQATAIDALADLVEDLGSEYAMEKAANEEFDYREAAKKKKKFIPKKLKKGRLTKYKKPGESMEQAALRARKSEDPSVRGMSALFLNVFNKKKKKKKEEK